MPMTTQELKQQIDKVLGNSIRCLLPSYWWKRLFNQVADRVDEVEQSTSKLIDSKVEEVKMPIVESVDELEKLELAKGRVAAVEKTGESATVKISDCYLSTNWEEDWDKYTIVKGVEEKDVIIDKDVSASVMFSASKETINKDALQVTAGSGIFNYVKWADEKAHFTSLEEVNKALSSGKYRAIFGLNDPDDCFIDDYFTFYLAKPQPSLYIKGDSWERLLKEGDVTGGADVTIDSELSDTSENPVQNKAVKAYVDEKVANIGGTTIREFYIGDSLTDEQKAWNVETLELAKQGKAIVRTTLHGNTFILELFNEDNDYQFGYTQFSPSGGVAISVGVAEDGLAGIKIEEFHFDSELSDTSTNAVQNKVVTAALNNKADKSDIKTINGVSLLGGGNIVVDVDTSDLATKEELNAYATSESLQSLGLRIQSDMDTDKRELTEAINTKQDKIDDLEAIRSGAALGATALQEHQDISHLATKEEVIANEEVTASALNDLNDRISELAENVQGETVTKEEFETAISNANNTILENEEVTAEAFMDIHQRLVKIERALANLSL